MAAGGGEIVEESPSKLSQRAGSSKPMPLESSEHVMLMNRLTKSPPLVLSTDLFETGFEPAHVMLDEPLCPLPAARGDDSLEAQGDLATIACICAQMHVLIEKEAQLAQDPDGPQSAIMETVNTGLERLYSQLQRECMALHPQLQLHESMHVTGMLQMFPVVAERLQVSEERRARMQAAERLGIVSPPSESAQLPCEEAPAKDQVTFKEYLAHISQLHQCLSMSMQIQGDLPNTNHKYMAHQVALLYQTLSYQNLKCSAFKKRIEPKFDIIKKVTEASSTPELQPSLKSWLRDITNEIMAQTTDFSSTPCAHVAGWLDALAYAK